MSFALQRTENQYVLNRGLTLLMHP